MPTDVTPSLLPPSSTRQLCNHPFLLLNQEVLSSTTSQAALMNDLIQCSGKFVVLDRLLLRLKVRRLLDDSLPPAQPTVLEK